MPPRPAPRADLETKLGPNGHGYRTPGGPVYPEPTIATSQRGRNDRITPAAWVDRIRDHYLELHSLEVRWRKGRAEYSILVEFPMVFVEPVDGAPAGDDAGAAFDLARAAQKIADACWTEVVAYTESTNPRGDYQLRGIGLGKGGDVSVLFEAAKQCWLEHLDGNGANAWTEDSDSPTQGAMRALTVALADARKHSTEADKRAEGFYKLAMDALKAAPDVITGGTVVLERGIALMDESTKMMDAAAKIRADALLEWQNAKRWEAEIEAGKARTDQFASVAHHGIEIMGGELASMGLLMAKIVAERSGVESEGNPANLCEACDAFSDSITVKQHTILSPDCATELFAVLEACSKMETDREAAHALTAFLATYAAELETLRPHCTARQTSLLRYIDGEIQKNMS